MNILRRFHLRFWAPSLGWSASCSHSFFACLERLGPVGAHSLAESSDPSWVVPASKPRYTAAMGQTRLLLLVNGALKERIEGGADPSNQYHRLRHVLVLTKSTENHHTAPLKIIKVRFLTHLALKSSALTKRSAES